MSNPKRPVLYIKKSSISSLTPVTECGEKNLKLKFLPIIKTKLLPFNGKVKIVPFPKHYETMVKKSSNIEIINALRKQSDVSDNSFKNTFFQTQTPADQDTKADVVESLEKLLNCKTNQEMEMHRKATDQFESTAKLLFSIDTIKEDHCYSGQKTERDSLDNVSHLVRSSDNGGEQICKRNDYKLPDDADKTIVTSITNQSDEKAGDLGESSGEVDRSNLLRRKQIVQLIKCGDHDGMNELHDEYAVKLGGTFPTIKDFVNYVNGHGRRWLLYYTCISSFRYPSETDKYVMKYTYRCVFYKRPGPLPGKVYQRKIKLRYHTKCPSKIALAQVRGDNYLTVVDLCHHHNHPFTEERFYNLPHMTKLPVEIKKEVHELLFADINIVILRKYILATTGLGISLRVYSNTKNNLKKKMNESNEAYMTEEKRQQINQKIAKIYEKYGPVREFPKKKQEYEKAAYKRKLKKLRDQHLLSHNSDNHHLPESPNEVTVKHPFGMEGNAKTPRKKRHRKSSLDKAYKKSRLEERLACLSDDQDVLASVRQLQESIRKTSDYPPKEHNRNTTAVESSRRKQFDSPQNILTEIVDNLNDFENYYDNIDFGGDYGIHEEVSADDGNVAHEHEIQNEVVLEHVDINNEKVAVQMLHNVDYNYQQVYYLHDDKGNVIRDGIVELDNNERIDVASLLKEMNKQLYQAPEDSQIVVEYNNSDNTKDNSRGDKRDAGVFINIKDNTGKYNNLHNTKVISRDDKRDAGVFINIKDIKGKENKGEEPIRHEVGVQTDPITYQTKYYSKVENPIKVEYFNGRHTYIDDECINITLEYINQYNIQQYMMDPFYPNYIEGLATKNNLKVTQMLQSIYNGDAMIKVLFTNYKKKIKTDVTLVLITVGLLKFNAIEMHVASEIEKYKCEAASYFNMIKVMKMKMVSITEHDKIITDDNLSLRSEKVKLEEDIKKLEESNLSLRAEIQQLLIASEPRFAVKNNSSQTLPKQSFEVDLRAKRTRVIELLDKSRPNKRTDNMLKFGFLTVAYNEDAIIIKENLALNTVNTLIHKVENDLKEASENLAKLCLSSHIDIKNITKDGSFRKDEFFTNLSREFLYCRKEWSKMTIVLKKEQEHFIRTTKVCDKPSHDDFMKPVQSDDGGKIDSKDDNVHDTIIYTGNNGMEVIKLHGKLDVDTADLKLKASIHNNSGPQAKEASEKYSSNVKSPSEDDVQHGEVQIHEQKAETIKLVRPSEAETYREMTETDEELKGTKACPSTDTQTKSLNVKSAPHDDVQHGEVEIHEQNVETIELVRPSEAETHRELSETDKELKGTKACPSTDSQTKSSNVKSASHEDVQHGEVEIHEQKIETIELVRQSEAETYREITETDKELKETKAYPSTDTQTKSSNVKSASHDVVQHGEVRIHERKVETIELVRQSKAETYSEMTETEEELKITKACPLTDTQTKS